MRHERMFLAASLATVVATGAAAQMAKPQHDEMRRPTAGVATAAPSQTTNSVAGDTALMGREVFSKDQMRVGQVEMVVASAEGTVLAIHVKAGGFLGFGGKMVVIPHEKFHMRGSNVQLDLTSDEVNHMP